MTIKNLQHSACQRLRWGAKHSPSILECVLLQAIIVNSSGSSIVLFKIRLDHPGYSSSGSEVSHVTNAFSCLPINSQLCRATNSLMRVKRLGQWCNWVIFRKGVESILHVYSILSLLRRREVHAFLINLKHFWHNLKLQKTFDKPCTFSMNMEGTSVNKFDYGF